MNRKEAIEYIKWYFAEDDGMAADASVKEAIQALVPELKESKDERIRKSLIKHFENYYEMYDKTCGEPKFGDDNLIVRDIISYLEKQKEQKPVNWTELNWEDINKLEDFINIVHNEYPNGIGQESFGEEVLERFREYKEDEDLDEKEQKPAEWSEEDKKMLEGIIERGQAQVQWCDTGLRPEQVSWLKLLRSRPKPFDYWVPTEEQLHALYLASYGGELSSEDCLELDSLLIDLKKLYSL